VFLDFPNEPGTSTGIYLDRPAMKKKATSRFLDIAGSLVLG
jgi:hypothetical protein